MFPSSLLPFSLLGLSLQLPLRQTSLPETSVMSSTPEFAFKEGADVFTPKDLIELARPGSGVANEGGDLVLIPVSKYSFEGKKWVAALKQLYYITDCILRNHKSIFIAALESDVQPFKIPLTKGGEAFWLDSRTVAHVVENEKSKNLELYTLSVKFETQDASTLTVPENPILVGNFPTSTATNFQYVPGPGRLVFSDNVFADGNLTTVKDQEDKWENRGTSALVYDSTYERYVWSVNE
jgi:hypothetical protein